MQELIDISKAFLTPMIGVIAVYIAYQQHRTNRLREQRESRKAKLDVYRKVKRFLHDVDSSRTIPGAQYEEFVDAIAEADFLFPEDITNWLEELHSAAAQWRDIEEQILEHTGHSPSPMTRVEFEMQVSKEPTWAKELLSRDTSIEDLQTAHCNVKKKFSRYLKLR